MQVQWKHKHAHVIRMSIILSYLDVYVCLHHVQSVCINNYLCQKYSLVTTHRGVSHMTVHDTATHISHVTVTWLTVSWYNCTHVSETHLWLAATCALTSLRLSSWRHRVPLLPGYLPRDVSSSVRPVRICVCTCVFGREGGLNSICPVVIHLSIHPSIHLSIYPCLSLFPYLLLERCHSGQLKQLHTHSLL